MNEMWETAAAVVAGVVLAFGGGFGSFVCAIHFLEWLDTPEIVGGDDG